MKGGKRTVWRSHDVEPKGHHGVCFHLFVMKYVMHVGQCLNYVPEVLLWKFLLTHDTPQLLKVCKNSSAMRGFLIDPWWEEPSQEWEALGFPAIGVVFWGLGRGWAGWRSRGELVLVSVVTRTWEQVLIACPDLHIASWLYVVLLHLVTQCIHLLEFLIWCWRAGYDNMFENVSLRSYYMIYWHLYCLSELKPLRVPTKMMIPSGWPTGSCMVCSALPNSSPTSSCHGCPSTTCWRYVGFP